MRFDDRDLLFDMSAPEYRLFVGAEQWASVRSLLVCEQRTDAADTLGFELHLVYFIEAAVANAFSRSRMQLFETAAFRASCRKFLLNVQCPVSRPLFVRGTTGQAISGVVFLGFEALAAGFALLRSVGGCR
jgi:hypothetical protein